MDYLSIVMSLSDSVLEVLAGLFVKIEDEGEDVSSVGKLRKLFGGRLIRKKARNNGDRSYLAIVRAAGKKVLDSVESWKLHSQILLSYRDNLTELAGYAWLQVMKGKKEEAAEAREKLLSDFHLVAYEFVPVLDEEKEIVDVISPKFFKDKREYDSMMLRSFMHTRREYIKAQITTALELRDSLVLEAQTATDRSKKEEYAGHARVAHAELVKFQAAIKA